MNTKVVNLGVVRDLLAELDKVRAAVISGEVCGFHAAMQDADGRETIYLGGVYRQDPEAALKGALRASMARAMMDDAPLIEERACRPQ